MSAFYGPARPEEEMVELIHYAVEKLGVTFLDTSDVYGPFTNEILVGKVNNAFKPAALQTIIVLRVIPSDAQYVSDPAKIFLTSKFSYLLLLQAHHP